MPLRCRRLKIGTCSGGLFVWRGAVRCRADQSPFRREGSVAAQTQFGETGEGRKDRQYGGWPDTFTGCAVTLTRQSWHESRRKLMSTRQAVDEVESHSFHLP